MVQKFQTLWSSMHWAVWQDMCYCRQAPEIYGKHVNFHAQVAFTQLLQKSTIQLISGENSDRRWYNSAFHKEHLLKAKSCEDLFKRAHAEQICCHRLSRTLMMSWLSVLIVSCQKSLFTVIRNSFQIVHEESARRGKTYDLGSITIWQATSLRHPL